MIFIWQKHLCRYSVRRMKLQWYWKEYPWFDMTCDKWISAAILERVVIIFVVLSKGNEKAKNIAVQQRIKSCSALMRSIAQLSFPEKNLIEDSSASIVMFECCAQRGIKSRMTHVSFSGPWYNAPVHTYALVTSLAPRQLIWLRLGRI